MQGDEGNQETLGVKSALDYLIREKLLNLPTQPNSGPSSRGIRHASLRMYGGS
jgi:hypothetical protein